MKLNEMHERFLVKKIEAKPDSTLEELSDLLYSEYLVRVTVQTISRHLDGLLIKDLRVEVDSVNRAKSIEEKEKNGL